MNSVTDIATQFTKDKELNFEKIGGGHINQTYLIHTEQGANPGAFILQEINTHVFHDPEGLVQNLVKISNHLLGSGYPYQPVFIKRTNDHKLLYHHDSETWRALEFIDNSLSVEKAGNPEIVEMAGTAFGELTKAMLTMDPGELIETIPDFHNPEKRFNDLLKAVDVAPANKKELAQSLIEHALALSMIVEKYKNIITKLPVRVAHNDAKVGNILFNDSLSKVIAIIDLDTMMPGYLMNDFGDMARSMCNPADEDSPDLKSVYFDDRKFQFLTKGYLGVLRDEITDLELNSLITGIKKIIYTQFIRFLTDFLSGDIYYQTAYPEHNLNRARVQLKLLLDFQGKEDDLTNVITENKSI